MINTRKFWFLFIGIVAVIFIFAPDLRLRYVIWRIESAKTPREERSSFRLVRRYYYAFYRYERTKEPHNQWVRQGEEFTIQITGVPPFTDEQFSATRILLANTNFDYLEGSFGTPVPY
jgi:hypothetical protein